MKGLILAACVAAAAAQSWTIVNSQTSVGVGLNNIAITEDGKTGVVAVGDGLGYNMRRTTDGGNTWTTVPSQDGYIFGLNGAAATGTSAVGIGDLATQFSVNSGVYFNSSLLGGPGGAVYARTFFTPSQGYVQIGAFNSNQNGIAISTDAGLSWTTLDATTALNNTGAVGAACLPNNIYYVVGADGPQQVQEDETDPREAEVVRVFRPVPRSSRIAIKVYRDGSMRTVMRNPTPGVPRSGVEYRGVIVRSNDGGKTWNTLNTERGRYLLQAVDCSDAAGQNCCVVGEADSGNFAGAYVRCTTNGGANWTIVHNDTTTGASLIDIRAVSATEWWAVGGTVTSTAISGSFWHGTVSGGTFSWTLDTQLPNYYVTALNCNAGGCFASVIDDNQNSYVAKHSGAVAKAKLRGTA